MRDWYNQTILDSVAKSPEIDLTTSSDALEVYYARSCDILISNSNGQKTGYVNNQLIDNIPNALPLMSETGQNQAPTGFYLPLDSYTVRLNNFKNSGTVFTCFDETNTIHYARTGTSLSQTDNLIFGNGGLNISNPDNVAKKINLTASYEDLGNEMYVEIKNLDLGANASNSLEIFNNTNEIKLFNSGQAGTYNLYLRYASSNGETRFAHDTITIAKNTAHTIRPDWNNLQTANVWIFVDKGNNNIIEDTLFFGNSEPPMIMTYPVVLNKSIDSSLDTIHITNCGGGLLNWTVSSSDTSWLKLTGPVNGTNLGQVLVSVNTNNGSARSAKLNIIAPGASNNSYRIMVSQQGLLNIPTGVAASDGTYPTEIHVSWNADSGATHYKVYRSDNAGSNGIGISEWITETTFIDTSVVKGQFYYYRITAAQNDTGLNESGYSEKDAGSTSCFTAGFKFSGECTGQPTTFIDNSNALTSCYYSWDINNDGITDYSGKQIHHTFDIPGLYTVKLTVTDSVSCTSTKEISVNILPFPVLTLIQDTTVCAGQSVTLNAGNGFNSYLWSNGAVTPSITLDTTGVGLGFVPVYVKVSYGTACTFTKAVNIYWDTCANIGGFNLSGNITYDNPAATPLNNTVVKLIQNGTVQYETTADAQGHYAFANIMNGNYQVVLSSNKTWGGVNSTDALKVLRHFTALTLLEGVRLIAADVNGVNGINSVDALLMVKRFVNLINSFTVGDWAFDHPTLTVSGPGNQTLDIKGVTFGDVDGSYVPPAD